MRMPIGIGNKLVNVDANAQKRQGLQMLILRRNGVSIPGAAAPDTGLRTPVLARKSRRAGTVTAGEVAAKYEDGRRCHRTMIGTLPDAVQVVD